MAGEPPRSRTELKGAGLPGDVLTFLRGLLMGAADIVPGVSGGTVALIVGIYRRLVTAISHFDFRLLADLRGGNWRDAAAHVDARFLLALGMGIATGIVALGSTMETLLTGPVTRPVTLAAFFGMILASSYVVFRMISLLRPVDVAAALILGVGGAGVAYWITGLQPSTVDPRMGYIFLCGMIAICAMILPGISGAYLLLVLGLYSHLTAILKSILHGTTTTEDLLVVMVFGTGCAVGLIMFSKVLRWLLTHYQGATMALLCGFMIGALRKIWPFQQDLTPSEVELRHKIFAPVFFPESLPAALWCIAVGVLAFSAVLVLDRLARRTAHTQERMV